VKIEIKNKLNGIKKLNWRVKLKRKKNFNKRKKEIKRTRAKLKTIKQHKL
jgi:hypothetical protein